MHYAAPKIHGFSHSPARVNHYAWFVLVFASMFFFYEFMQMNIMNAIGPGIRLAFGINATDFGKLGAYYADANILFLFVAGALLDRYSTRKTIVSALTLCALATYLLSQSNSLDVAKLSRFLTGIGGSFCLLSCVRLASRWFPPERMALATGIIVTIGMLGGAIAQTPMTILVEHIGWRSALIFDATFGAILVLVILTLVRDYPSDNHHIYLQGQEKLNDLPVLKRFRIAFSNPQNWLSGVYTSLMNFPIALLGSTWGALYLQSARGFDAQDASIITMMLFVGTIFGSSIMGGISDKLRRRKLPMLVGAVLSMIVVLIALYTPITSFTVYIVLFLLLGFLTSTQVITYPLIAESNVSYLTATSMSIASMLILGGYAVFIPLFGTLMDKIWHGQLNASGLRIYTAQDFHFALLLFPAAFVIAFLAAWFTRETYCCAVEES